MLKIIAGNLKGRRLKISSKPTIRPTLGKVREALFNILGNRILNVKMADLFAGTGALGIEALSRGAMKCLFVEKSPIVIKLLKENLVTLELVARANVLKLDLLSAFASYQLGKHGPFDLILADPPYGYGLADFIVWTVAKANLMTPNGMLVVEYSSQERFILPPNLIFSDYRIYGQTKLVFLKY